MLFYLKSLWLLIWLCISLHVPHLEWIVHISSQYLPFVPLLLLSSTLLCAQEADHYGLHKYLPCLLDSCWVWPLWRLHLYQTKRWLWLSSSTKGHKFCPGYCVPVTIPCRYYPFFPGGSDSKESACNAGDPGSIPGSERSPGEGNGNHSSIVAWRIPWSLMSLLQSMGSQRVGQDWVTNTTPSCFVEK